jgi:hypothetical protein
MEAISAYDPTSPWVEDINRVYRAVLEYWVIHNLKDFIVQDNLGDTIKNIEAAEAQL